ncbi:hypothetical protein QWY28_06500 [Nocardioides sp. SOB77]|uniref:Small CPxCG-related zinc finger protein n=1 Tax=Nocardioides oceani TaxID=3058369 RepID=A0ABT8FDC7_9ACTN|nr:hypothetical protein [Nocardioides oceani]MDN4172586.1 hypothetical protein [Nocardioides oceani]
MGEGDDQQLRRPPEGCAHCGALLVPRLTATARPAGEDGPLCAESPVRLACPTCT